MYVCIYWRVMRHENSDANRIENEYLQITGRNFGQRGAVLLFMFATIISTLLLVWQLNFRGRAILLIVLSWLMPVCMITFLSRRAAIFWRIILTPVGNRETNGF